MRVLHLTLKKKWFDMILSGEKKEEYREIKSYWCAQFACLNGKKLKKEQWRVYLITSGKLYMKLCSKPNSPINPITFNNYDTNIMKLGYPSKNDTLRIIKFKHEGIEIRTGREEWGAEPNKLYFVIKHGLRIE